MSYQCPKGHTSADPDYCSECGAKIGKSSAMSASSNVSPVKNAGAEDICPDCGTPRVQNARFCEVCRHDFIDGKTGTAEKVIASSGPEVTIQPEIPPQPVQTDIKPEPANPQESTPVPLGNTGKTQAPETPGLNIVSKNEIVIGQKLNIVISVDKVRLSQNQIETGIKPDSVDRVFPLDLDENLVGRRSAIKGIYPEIEINDPGVSHRHLKFNKQGDGTFAVLELGSANGTEYNGVQLEPGVSTVIKAGDEFAIGLWTILKVVAR